MKASRAGLIELENRYGVLPCFTRSGFVPFLPELDAGIDFVALREASVTEDGDMLIKAQLKGRWTIDRKYCGRGIAVAFPDGGHWYVAPHDAMVALAADEGYTATRSWEQGTYSIPSMGGALRERHADWRLDASDPSRNEPVWHRLTQGQS